ncbi:MAG: hypothetical protein Q9159_005305 [Coniocarpon cinnabarinum]
MSSGKLDQSLDDIVKTNRPRRVIRRRVVKTTKTEAPSGGVTKKSRPNKGAKASKSATAAAEAAAKLQSTAAASTRRESKIVVTGLPSDVTQQQIKAMLTYGPDGQSRGVATIIFSNPNSALEAATNLNGVKVDNRAMKIEVIVGAEQAPGAAPAKGLGDRIAQPKGQPKKAEGKASTKANAKSATKPAGKKGKATKGAGAARRKPKTTEELDAEMTDYFGPGTVATGQENTAVNGNTMEDEIMVSEAFEIPGSVDTNA